MSGFYAVKVGRNPGIYRTWEQCRENVHKYPGATYKKFKNKEDAEKYMNGNNISVIEPNKLSSSDPFKILCPSPKRKRLSDGEKQRLIKKKMKTMEINRTVIYTDGACKNNGYNKTKGGIGVYFGDNDLRNVASVINGYVTNNRAELTAVIVALQICLNRNDNYIEIKTDSEYIVKGITEYISSWKERNWKNIKNIDLWTQLDELNNKLNVKWTHVSAHSGIHGNEMADHFATYYL